MTADERSLSEQNVRLLQENTAQSTQLRALRAELLSASDTLRLASNVLNLPTLTQSQLDLIRRMAHDAEHARAVLRGEGA